MKLHNTTSLWR